MTYENEFDEIKINGSSEKIITTDSASEQSSFEKC